MPTREEAKQAAVAVAAPESKVEAPEGDATATKPEKAPKPPKTPKEPTACTCGVPDQDKTGAPATGDAVKFTGCRGGKSTRRFAPGHDAKLAGYLTRQYAAGRVTFDEAIDIVKERSGGSALLVPKVKRALKLVDEAKAANARRDQAAQDEKAKSAAGEASTPEAEVEKVAANA